MMMNEVWDLKADVLGIQNYEDREDIIALDLRMLIL